MSTTTNRTAAPSKNGKRRAGRFQPFSEVRSESRKWIWNGFLEAGTVSLLLGDAKVGKSMLSIKLAEAISKGTLHGSSQPSPRGAVIISTEDRIKSDIKPRLQVLDTDSEVVGTLKFSDNSRFSIPADINLLRHVIRDQRLGLVVIDPIIGHTDVRDINNQKQVRDALEPLTKLAEETRCAIIGLIHPNKSGEARGYLQKASGSGAFTQVARNLLLVSKDPEDPNGDTRIISGLTNHGRPTTSQRLRIESKWIILDSGERQDEGYMVLTYENVEYSADELVNMEVDSLRSGPASKPKLELAKDWLVATLSNGPKLKTHIDTEAQALGITKITLDRAKQALSDVHSHRRKGDGKWLWYLGELDEDDVVVKYSTTTSSSSTSYDCNVCEGKGCRICSGSGVIHARDLKRRE